MTLNVFLKENDNYGSVMRADKAVHRSIFSLNTQAVIMNVIYIHTHYFPARDSQNLETLKQKPAPGSEAKRSVRKTASLCILMNPLLHRQRRVSDMTGGVFCNEVIRHTETCIIGVSSLDFFQMECDVSQAK